MANNEIPQALLPSETVVPQEQRIEVNKPEPGTIPLLQLENNAIINALPADIDVAVRSGEYVPKKDQIFMVKDTNGELGQVQGANLKKVLDAGYLLESPEEAHARTIQEKYGDQGLRTFTESALGSATFGLSTVAGAAAGQAQDIAGREEANPVASIAGEVAGFIPGLFIGTTEANLGIKALRALGTPVKAVSKAAGIAEKKVASALAKAGVEGTAAKSIISKMAQAGTAGAVEGVALGTGALIHESALGKADVNAENLIGHIGLGALVGGGFGATLGAAMEALPKIKLAPKAVQEVVSDFTNPEKAALDLLNLSPSKIAKEEIKNPGFAKELSKFLKDDVMIGKVKTIDEIAAKISELKQQSGKNFSPIITKIDAMMDVAPELKVNRKTMFNDLGSMLDDMFSGTVSHSPDAKLARKKFDDYFEQVKKAADTGGSANASELFKLRRLADENSGWGKKYSDLSIEEKAARFSRDYYNDLLKNSIYNASEKGAVPELAAQFKEANRLYSMSTKYEQDALRAAAKKPNLSLSDMVIGAAGLGSMGPYGLAVLGAKKFLESDTRKALAVLGKIEKANVAMNKVIDKSVTNFFEPAAKITKPVLIKKLTDTIYGTDLNDKKPKDMQQAYNNFQNKMEAYRANPELFMQKVNRTTALMYDGAPDTSTAIDATAVRGMMFLDSKLPRRKSMPGVLDIIKPQKLPSNMELAKFHRYVTAVDDPKTVLHDLDNGTISHEGVEALREVYPNLYQKVQQVVGEKLQQEGAKLSYNKRIQLGMLFGITADESMIPENLLGLQANFQQQQQPETGGAVNSTQTGVAKINKAKNLESATEKDTELS